MRIYHNSQDSLYRSPFGACTAGSRITLRLLVAETVPESVTLRLWMDEREIRLPMVQDESGLFTATFAAPTQPQLVWYYFIVTQNGKTFYYTNNRERLGGAGEIQMQPNDQSYQITVYEKNFKTPGWFKDAILYQIFPDRFFGLHTKEDMQKKRPEYILHSDWYEPIAFNPHPHENGPACNDFYGGNLAGITEKLPYLKSLGISAIYLNPIFDAYSNHKYDTADYKNIDPMFGTEEEFSALCAKAEALGIRIILDGVFSHTGADSIYFNKYGAYGQHSGAYQDPFSPYRSWYQFTDYPNYESWWGCSNLPNVNEMDNAYLDYILRDDDAVVKKWLHKGAKGWRLDVADELPDEFIALLRENVKQTDPDAIIIGEVWEDASNKVAYGKLRSYLLGRELDSVMNYPFKDQVISFLMQWTSAEELNRRMLSLMENYPKESLYTLMNIVGTHDTMRIKSVMGGMDQNCGTQRLSSSMEELAVYRVKLAAFLQMTFVGVPCIYYGDEVGMQGGRDPFNRGTYPWRAVDSDLRGWYQTMAALRNSHSCLRQGEFIPLLAEGDIYVYARYNKDGKDAFGKDAEHEVILCAVNRGFSEKTLSLDLHQFPFSVYIRGIFEKEVQTIRDKSLTFTLPPLGAEIFISSC